MAQTDINKPACFGAATVFSFDSDICRNCVCYDECSNAAKQRLEHIRKVINVDDLLAQHEKARKQGKARRAARKAIEQESRPVASPQPQKPVDKPVERTTPIAKVTFEIDKESHSVIAKIPNQKAQAQAVVLCKSNMIEIAKKEFGEGRNPFLEGPKYLSVAAEALLEGGFTRSTLKERYVKDLGWTESTSASHVSIVVGLLPAFGIIKQEGDLFIINKEA